MIGLALVVTSGDDPLISRELLGVIITAGLLLLGTIITARVSGRAANKATIAASQAQERAADLQERTVDREQFDAVMREHRLNTEGLRNDAKELRALVDELRRDLAREHDARVRAEQRTEDADARASAAAARASRLERRVTQLEEVLRAHDIAVPRSLGSET